MCGHAGDYRVYFKIIVDRQGKSYFDKESRKYLSFWVWYSVPLPFCKGRFSVAEENYTFRKTKNSLAGQY